MVLSPPARGERAKTGSDQGFLIDCPILTEVIRCVLQTMRPGDKFFPRPRGHVAKWWCWGLAVLGIKRPRALHVLRHMKPTDDAARGIRDVQEIQRRGRWSQPKSCNRYSKPYMLTKARAETPPRVLAHGDAVEADLPVVLCRAIRAGTSVDSPICEAILRALAKAKA